MLGTTFLGQRYDPQLKLKKSSSVILFPMAAVPDPDARSSIILDNLTIGGSSITTSSLRREVSILSLDHPSLQSQEDYSVSTTNSSFGCPIGYPNDTNTKKVTSGNTVSISFQLPKLTPSGDSTIEEDNALNTAQAQAHIPGSSISGGSSEETGTNLRVRERNPMLLFHRSVLNGDHHDDCLFPCGNRFRDSNSTIGFSDFPRSTPNDHDEYERHPDYTSSVDSLDEEDVDAVAPEATTISTNASNSDTNSSIHSRRSSNTTSSPISPVIFRSRSSILEHVVISSNNDQAESDASAVPEWEDPGREGDDMRATSPALPSVRAVESTAWWRNTSTSHQQLPLCARRWHKEVEPMGGDGPRDPIPIVPERRALIDDRLTAGTGIPVGKPLPAPPPLSLDGEDIQSHPRKNILSFIFPCLPVAAAPRKQRPNESEKCSVKPSDHLHHASRAQDTLCGRVAMRFRKRQRGCSPCIGDVETEKGQRHLPDMLEVRVEREISRTVDA